MGRKCKMYGQFRKFKTIHQNKELEKKQHLISLRKANLPSFFSQEQTLCVEVPLCQYSGVQLQVREPALQSNAWNSHALSSWLDLPASPKHSEHSSRCIIGHLKNWRCNLAHNTRTVLTNEAGRRIWYSLTYVVGFKVRYSQIILICMLIHLY